MFKKISKKYTLLVLLNNFIILCFKNISFLNFKQLNYLQNIPYFGNSVLSQKKMKNNNQRNNR